MNAKVIMLSAAGALVLAACAGRPAVTGGQAPGQEQAADVLIN